MIYMIACVGANYELGYENDLIFKLGHDLNRFKELTVNNVVVMGRKTFDSIIEMNGEPLPQRISVVLTRDRNYKSRHGEIVLYSVEAILEIQNIFSNSDKKIFICGGSEIYEQLMPYTDTIYLTEVDEFATNVDTHFPARVMALEDFTLHSTEEYYSEKYECAYYFNEYRK